jgi:hypothetical protein
MNKMNLLDAILEEEAAELFPRSEDLIKVMTLTKKIIHRMAGKTITAEVVAPSNKTQHSEVRANNTSTDKVEEAENPNSVEFPRDKKDKLYDWAIAHEYDRAAFPNAFMPGFGKGWNAGFIVNKELVGVNGVSYKDSFERLAKEAKAKIALGDKQAKPPRIIPLAEFKAKGYTAQYRHLNAIVKEMRKSARALKRNAIVNLAKEALKQKASESAKAPVIKRTNGNKRVVLDPKTRENILQTILAAQQLKSSWSGGELLQHLKQHHLLDLDPKRLNVFMRELKIRGLADREGPSNASGKYVFTTQQVSDGS